MEQTKIDHSVPKKKTIQFGIRFPIDIYNKIEYIKQKTLLTKQQIVFLSCSKEIENWCKGLMDEELEARTSRIPQKPINVQEKTKPRYE